MLFAGDFIHGVVAVSRTSLLAGATELVDAIDAVISSAEWDTFVTMLPRIRAGMELLHGRHRDAIAKRVAERYGLREPDQLQKLDVSTAAAVDIVRLDQKVAEIMSRWSFVD